MALGGCWGSIHVLSEGLRGNRVWLGLGWKVGGMLGRRMLSLLRQLRGHRGDLCPMPPAAAGPL